jgi:hypothetical protein
VNVVKRGRCTVQELDSSKGWFACFDISTVSSVGHGALEQS